ncbi:MAG: NAD-dependent epimerase/dehydratase family protein [Planctomycetia bacterium]|nr:NAD-dependent epimerase/dehydratase family protein [Planctomycetia bacterium]
MRALVTGGGGFLGTYIVERLLARGDQVRIFCRGDYPELAARGVEIIRGDLRTRPDVINACRDMDMVFHTASLPGISVNRRPFYETNVLGTQHVLDACRENNIERLVYTSSPSVTDGGVPQTGVNESTPYPKRYLSFYPETKAIAERMVLQANGSPIANGSKQLLTCAIRPRLIWGPHDHHLIPRLIQRAQTGQLTRVGDGTNLLDMVYVENAADAHLLAADALTPTGPVAGNAYYISQGEPINCWDWINRILELVGLEHVRRAVSFKTAWRVGWCYECMYRLLRLKGEPPMTRFLATQLAQSYWFDISRAQHDFGYAPRISTEEGLARLAEDLKSRNISGKNMGNKSDTIARRQE